MVDNFNWTPELTAVLVQLVYRGLDIDKIAAILGCSQEEVSDRFYNGTERYVTDLSKDERKWLRASFHKSSYDEMQCKIKASLASLMLIAICLGLRKRSDGNGWSYYESYVLKRLRADGKDVNVCAAFLGRSKKGIEHKLYDKKEHFVTAKEKGRKLTDEELQWFIANYPNKKNADIQRRFGISFSYVHRLARQYGLTKTRLFMKKTQKAAQIAATESHIANGTYPPKGFIIPNSRKNCFKKGENGEMRWGKAKERRRIKKSAESRRIRYKRERLLVSCGLPQQTKLRVRSEPRSKICYRFGLRKLGYIQDHNDKGLFYYPADGLRRPLRESHAVLHGIRFRALNATYDDGTHEDLPTKLKSDSLRFVGELAIAPLQRKRFVHPPIPTDPEELRPVSTSIVRDLSAYSNDNSYSYDEI